MTGRKNGELINVTRNGEMKEWTIDVAYGSLLSDHFFAHNRSMRELANRNIFYRFNNSGLDYAGSRDVMITSNKLPLIFHKNEAELFPQQEETVLRAAKENKAVIVSGFSCPQERKIRRKLMKEKLPFIEIMDNGFPRKSHLWGDNLKAYKENRLVLVSTWKYKLQSHVTVGREMFCVMNELVRLITQQPDDWWKECSLHTKDSSGKKKVPENKDSSRKTEI